MKLVRRSAFRHGVWALAVAAVLAGCTSTEATPIVIVLTPSPAASTPAPTPTPEATLSPTPELTPTPTPTPTPTSAAATCTGNEAHQAFFVHAAADLPFDVYCAVLPSSWWLDNASYDGPFLEVAYKNGAGAGIWLFEGGWCPPGTLCAGPGAPIGSASFDGLGGTLYNSGSYFTVEVGTLANPAYLMGGGGMSQAQFKAWAAAVVKVPKP
jgi:hypothetical protein